MLGSIAVALALLPQPSLRPAPRHCARASILRAASDDDLRKAFASQLASDKKEDGLGSFIDTLTGKKEPKKGLAKPKPGDERLPIRRGGAARDGSLGELRATQDFLLNLNPRDWQAEEYGLLAALAAIFGGIVVAYYAYVVPSENLGDSGGAYDYTKVRDTSDLGQCLERSYGTTEKSLCRFQYGTSPVDKARGIIGI